MNFDYGKISVIIPIYNEEKNLRRCVNSVLNQTYKNLEIILIDDGSRDNSQEICFDLAKNNDKIKVFCQLNKGVSSARNCGLANASGKYIQFIDADDVVSF